MCISDKNQTSDSVNTPKSALMLHFGTICYGSTDLFADRIAKELTDRGLTVTHYTCPKADANERLPQLLGQHYDIIFDINSPLPMTQSNGQYVLKSIGGELWHLILDHPLYHHDVLSCPIPDFNVICIDETHAAFVRRHYPHIKQVICLPLPADSAVKTTNQPDCAADYASREIDILFTATYTEPDAIQKQAKQQGAPWDYLFQDTVNRLLETPSLTLEEANANSLTSVLPKTEEELLKQLPLMMQANYLSDMYLRALLREELILNLLASGTPVTIYGHNWQLFYEKAKRAIPAIDSLLTLHKPVGYEQLPKLYANAKIAVNQLPWFKAGMHDRIPLALRGGCVCLTDDNDYLTARLNDGKHLYYYSIEDMAQAGAIAQSILASPDTARIVANQGKAYADAHMTWAHWVSKWLTLRAAD